MKLTYKIKKGKGRFKILGIGYFIVFEGSIWDFLEVQRVI